MARADQAAGVGDDHRIVLVVAGPGEGQLGEAAHGDVLQNHERLGLADQLGRPLLIESEAIGTAGHRVVVLAGDQVGGAPLGEDDHAIQLAVGLEQPVEILGHGRAALEGEGFGDHGADGAVQIHSGPGAGGDVADHGGIAPPGCENAVAGVWRGWGFGVAGGPSLWKRRARGGTDRVKRSQDSREAGPG